MIDEDQINKWFQEFPPSPAQKLAYSEVLDKAFQFAKSINENMPDGEDKMQVINSIRQNILTVELAIRYRYNSGIVLAKGVN